MTTWTAHDLAGLDGRDEYRCRLDADRQGHGRDGRVGGREALHPPAFGPLRRVRADDALTTQ